MLSKLVDQKHVHNSYHVKNSRLVMMSEEELEQALEDRVKLLIKQKLGVTDIMNKGRLFGIGLNKQVQILTIEQLIGVAIELGITEQQLQTDNSLFHVIGDDGSNHTFCIHDFETNVKNIFVDFASIIIDIFKLEINMIAPVILSNCHNSYLNEGIIFVLNDKQLGPTSQVIERQNPMFEQVLEYYS